MISNKIIAKEFLMELVYLWVEDYKNIIGQGFNFSPRFRCEYDEENNKPIINENKDYVSIFPDNINITAIVGENGSGKSSLLNYIGNKGTFFNKNNEVCKLEKEKDYKIIHINYDLLKINKPSYPNNYRIGLEYKNPYIRGKNTQTNINVLTFFKYIVNNILKHCYLFKSDIFFFNPIKIMFFDTLHPQKNNCKKLAEEVKYKNFSKERFLTFLYIKLFDIEKPEIREIESNILSIEKEIIEKFKIKNIENIYALLERIEESTILIEEFKDIYNVYKESLLELRNIGYLQIDFEDKEGREYFDLSQGERKIFTEMLMIFDEIKQSENNNFLLLLDEPDLTLHPDWQKRYISEMIKLLSNFSEKKFHLIVTTHSPFILSDLPKENIIFLEKGKQVYPFDDGKQTFGANIHTLLSHGFFMKDGLMGEFAKSKIDDVINYLNNKKSEIRNDKDAQNIIDIIGEPIIKRELQRMLKNKMELSNKTEIDTIKSQIELLTERLKKLEPKDKK